jgi:hypothetical protein
MKMPLCEVIAICCILVIGVLTVSPLVSDLEATVSECHPENPDCDFTESTVGVIVRVWHYDYKGHKLSLAGMNYYTYTIGWCRVHGSDPMGIVLTDASHCNFFDCPHAE